MKDLVERIHQVREEIDELTRKKNYYVVKIGKKKAVLEELEKLTVNQIDMFEMEPKQDIPDLINTEGR